MTEFNILTDKVLKKITGKYNSFHQIAYLVY